MASPRYQVLFAPAADRQLRKLPQAVQKRIVRSVEGLQANPRLPGAIKLQGEHDLYRIRAGEWRVVYQIADDRLVVLVVRIGHRGDVYRKSI
ncbi:MAG TPA: type II toxin-antitoxin system RelE/ParE family toxin [Planctomycetaceae bacterium]|nr:type II toxin-antitoxin system RelE/ParE family toxin [Planctomycetaceae bacterium]